ncbi:BTB/POZ domain protein [Apiospora phragmitis]|uniref:BTB/POZ domain protein n=1 Tax=Apiospora phragmitis TaxID=2905665 RepID=A0ABR1VS14_9PEZI
MSDVKVSCGGRTWNLDKIILCRSPFFEKAFMGGFKEAHERHITLEEPLPQEAHDIIFHIYTGKTPTDLEKDLSVGALTRMFELGDFFDLDGLRQYAVEGLQNTLSRLALPINELMMEGGCTSKVSPELVNVFSEIAKFGYGTDSETYTPTRDSVLTFFAITGMKALKLEQFAELVSKIPGMADQLLKALVGVDNSPISKFFLHDLPTNCYECHEPLHTFQCLEWEL